MTDPQPATAPDGTPTAGPSDDGTVTATEVVLTRLGGPEVLVARQVTLGPPPAGQLLVAVEAAGVAYAEVLMRRGRYPLGPTPPFVPGYDVVGTVVAAGSGASTPVGTRVAHQTPKTGGYASHVLVPDAEAVAVPAALEPVVAVALVLNGVTAYQLLHSIGRVQAGETVLVTSAAGGVGSLAVALGVAAGARVIGTASPGKAEQVRAAGAEFVDRTGDVVAQVRALAPGGVDVALDGVGGASLRTAWSVLGSGGRLASFGVQATKDDSRVAALGKVVGQLAAVRVRNLARGRSAAFYDINALRRKDPAGFRRDLATVLEMGATGDLRVPTTTYRLADVQAAHAALEAGAATGKLVLVP